MRGDRLNLRAAEVRRMLRLSHALHEAPADPVARKRVLLQGLCRLLRADSGVCLVSREVEAAPTSSGMARSVTVSMIRHGMTERDARTLAARYRSATGPRADPGEGDSTESVLDVPGSRAQACVALLRRRPSRRRFNRRDRRILDLLHSELAWVYRPELPPLSADGLPLSPRQRQTLQLLLAGNSEKQIGAQLGLSPNTVHHHAKAIHRHFGVSSRSELLARWVKK
jgi:DNA-binding CsgD family transcriptional regulator